MAGEVVEWVVRGGMGVVEAVVLDVVVASGEEERRGREEALVGWEGGVEAAEPAEEDMSVLGEWEGKKGSVVSVRCRFARREVKNAGVVC